MAMDMAVTASVPLRVRLEREAWKHAPRAGRRLNDKAWNEIRGAMLEGQYTSVLLFDESASTPAPSALQMRAPRLSAAVHASDLYEDIAVRVRDPAARERLFQAARPNPRFMNLAVRLGEGGFELSQSGLTDAVQRVQRTFREVHGACGLITLDPIQQIHGDRTQYERSRGVYWASSPEIYQTKLRGTFWGNLLSPSHVTVLGGYERIAREAPCRLIEPLTFQDARLGAYVQLTERPSQVTAQQLEALSRYFSPLLL